MKQSCGLLKTSFEGGVFSAGPCQQGAALVWGFSIQLKE